MTNSLQSLSYLSAIMVYISLEFYFSKDNSKWNVMEYAKCQIANLIQLAKVDGKLNYREILLVYGIAHQAKLSKLELDEIIEHPEQYNTTASFSDDEKVAYFYRLLILAITDTELSAEEQQLLKTIGTEIGLNSEKVELAIKYVIDNEFTDLSEDQLVEIIGG